MGLTPRDKLSSRHWGKWGQFVYQPDLNRDRPGCSLAERLLAEIITRGRLQVGPITLSSGNPSSLSRPTCHLIEIHAKLLTDSIISRFHMSWSDCAAIGCGCGVNSKRTVSTKTRVSGLARQKAKNGVDRGSLASWPAYQV